MPTPTDPAEAARTFNRRLGLVLFFLYCLAYAGFIGLAVGNRTALAAPVLGGINLAVVYGMGLIFGAGLLALVYLVAARREPGDEG